MITNPGCLGGYDFERIARFARKRFVEGVTTISLMLEAKDEREREEVALVCSMDIEDQQVKDLRLQCKHAEKCKITNCRSLLRRLIEQYTD